GSGSAGGIAGIVTGKACRHGSNPIRAARTRPEAGEEGRGRIAPSCREAVRVAGIAGWGRYIIEEWAAPARASPLVPFGLRSRTASGRSLLQSRSATTPGCGRPHQAGECDVHSGEGPRRVGGPDDPPLGRPVLHDRPTQPQLRREAGSGG